MAWALVMSLVQTAAARPYIVLLARSTTSSMFLNLMMLITGSEDLFLGDLHVVLHVGKDGRLDEVAAIAHASAAAEQFGAFLLAGLDVAHDFVELVVVHLRTLFGLRIEGIADRAALGARRRCAPRIRRRPSLRQTGANRRSSTGPG